MKSDAFAGTGKVFRFTLAQLLKSRANIRALIIVFVISLCSTPLLSLIRGGASGGNSSSVLYIVNQSGLSLDGLADYLKEAGLGDASFEEIEVLPAKPENEAILTLTKDQNGFSVRISGSTEKSAWPAQLVAAFLQRRLLLDAGFSAEQADALSEAGSEMILASDLDKAPSADTTAPDGVLPEEIDLGGEDGMSPAYTVQLGFSILLIMVSMISVSFVIRSVVEEKTSKLVDLLLVSVQPGALLLGKVMASLVYSVLYFACMLGGALLSRTVFGLFMDVSGVDNYLNGILHLDLAPDVLLVLLLTSLFGLLVFGILSGLCGAGCSSIEESGGAMSLCLFLIMGGYMVSIMSMAIGVPQGSTARAFSIIPVLSMFAAPTLYMYDAVGIGTVALGWLVHLILVFLLLLLAGKVYSSLIIYKGKRLGFRQILRLATGKEVSK